MTIAIRRRRTDFHRVVALAFGQERPWLRCLSASRFAPSVVSLLAPPSTSELPSPLDHDQQQPRPRPQVEEPELVAVDDAVAIVLDFAD
jgi:hypothetical protein